MSNKFIKIKFLKTVSSSIYGNVAIHRADHNNGRYAYVGFYEQDGELKCFDEFIDKLVLIDHEPKEEWLRLLWQYWKSVEKKWQ